jgi:outer membrane protein assembly factor BamB
LVGLRPEDGTVLWSFPWRTKFDANIATPIVASNYVFISSDYGAGCALVEITADGAGGLRAGPAYTRRNLMRNHHASSVVYRGFLYGFDIAGDGGAGILKCVDLRTGEEKWTSRRLGKGSLLAADGHLVILTEEGTLVLADGSPAGFKEQGRVADVLPGPQCWAMPSLAGGRLYLRDGQQIVCLDVGKK